LQARLAADMRPSERSRIDQSNRRYYAPTASGAYEQVEVAFPPATGYFNWSTISTLHSLVMAAQQYEQLPAVRAALEEWAARPREDPFEQFTFSMALACLQYWNQEQNAALATMNSIDALHLGTEFLILAQARMHYDSGNVQAALDAVESLRPTNQQMLVDRELTLLQLVLQLGDLDRARKSATKLFALRLDSDTEFQLADLMYQLNMGELADRMMSRIRRKAGGKQETLTALMQRYASNADMDTAAEIARQLVRRTQPAASRNRRTSESMQHEQALQILVRAKQIAPLIEQYEQMVARAPKSMKLVNQLAAAYEAAGRRADADQLRLQAAESAPSDPNSLFAAAQQLSANGNADKAVEMYIQAIQKSPTMLNDRYYD
ncbi:MAG: hypothetical protein KDA51_05105, partial [Planctomycetales bacterium]|nr:hypothetical protein [Planctomycetales bacterium]